MSSNLLKSGWVTVNREGTRVIDNNKLLEEKMKAEILRILLKHPYQRQLPNRVKMYIASNLTIGNNTSFSEAVFKNTRDFFGSWQYDKASFEEIYDAIKETSFKLIYITKKAK